MPDNFHDLFLLVSEPSTIQFIVDDEKLNKQNILSNWSNWAFLPEVIERAVFPSYYLIEVLQRKKRAMGWTFKTLYSRWNGEFK